MLGMLVQRILQLFHSQRKFCRLRNPHCVSTQLANAVIQTTRRHGLGCYGSQCVAIRYLWYGPSKALSSGPRMGRVRLLMASSRYHPWLTGYSKPCIQGF
jgi:hypothetical protein